MLHAFRSLGGNGSTAGVVRALLLALTALASFTGGMVWWNVTGILDTVEASAKAIVRIETRLAEGAVRDDARDRRLDGIDAALRGHDHRLEALETRASVLETQRRR